MRGRRLGARGQLLGAGRDLVAGRRQVAGAGAHVAHDVAQRLLHVRQDVEQEGRLVLAVRLGAGGQVAGRDGLQVAAHLAQAVAHDQGEGVEQVTGHQQAGAHRHQGDRLVAVHAVHARLQQRIELVDAGLLQRLQRGDDLAAHVVDLRGLGRAAGGGVVGHQVAFDIDGLEDRLGPELGLGVRMDRDHLGQVQAQFVRQVFGEAVLAAEFHRRDRAALAGGGRGRPQHAHAGGLLEQAGRRDQRGVHQVVGVQVGVQRQAAAVGDLAQHGQQGRAQLGMGGEHLRHAVGGSGGGLQCVVQVRNDLVGAEGVAIAGVHLAHRLQVAGQLLAHRGGLSRAGAGGGVAHGEAAQLAAVLDGRQHGAGEFHALAFGQAHLEGVAAILHVDGHQQQQRQQEGRGHDPGLGPEAQVAEQRDGGSPEGTHGEVVGAARCGRSGAGGRHRRPIRIVEQGGSLSAPTGAD